MSYVFSLFYVQRLSHTSYLYYTYYPEVNQVMRESQMKALVNIVCQVEEVAAPPMGFCETWSWEVCAWLVELGHCATGRLPSADQVRAAMQSLGMEFRPRREYQRVRARRLIQRHLPACTRGSLRQMASGPGRRRPHVA